MIGLGVHGISKFRKAVEYFLKHPRTLKYRDIAVRTITKILIHPKYKAEEHDRFDFALFQVNAPIQFSKQIRPVCLPLKSEYDTMYVKENLVTGFGVHKIWIHEYERLLGERFLRNTLFTMETLKKVANGSKINYELQTNITDEFLEAFVKIFPGFENCIRNHNFVCNITNETLNEMTAQIKERIENAIHRNEENEVNGFLGLYINTQICFCI